MEYMGTMYLLPLQFFCQSETSKNVNLKKWTGQDAIQLTKAGP